MIKKICSLALITIMILSVGITNSKCISHAQEGITLKRGDKILIGNDYWRVLDPDYANNGEDGIFITLDTFDSKYKSIYIQRSITQDFMPVQDWSDDKSGLHPNNEPYSTFESQDCLKWADVISQIHEGDYSYTEVYNTVMRFYQTYIDGYLDNYIIDTNKPSDETRTGKLDSTQYYKENIKPKVDQWMTLSNEEKFHRSGSNDANHYPNLHLEFWNKYTPLTKQNTDLIGNISYRPECSGISNDKIFPLSVEELRNLEYFPTVEDRKLYTKEGKSVNYWTRNYFIGVRENIFTDSSKAIGSTIGFSFLNGKDGRIIDDYTGCQDLEEHLELTDEPVKVVRPAMNLSKDIINKLDLIGTNGEENIYEPNFAEDSASVHLKAGDVIKLGGVEWIVLDPQKTSVGGKGIFVIAKNYIKEFGDAVYGGDFDSTMIYNYTCKKQYNRIYESLLKDRYGDYILYTSKGDDWDKLEITTSSSKICRETTSTKITMQRLFSPSIAEINDYIKKIDGAGEYTSANSNEKRGYWTRNAEGYSTKDGYVLNAWNYAYFGNESFYPVDPKEDDSIIKYYLRPCMNLKYSVIPMLENDSHENNKYNSFKLKTYEEIIIEDTSDDGFRNNEIGEQSKIYRLYNGNTGEHLFTSKLGEYISLVGNGWTGEGWSFEGYAKNSKEGNTPIYRLYNANAKGGDHHYTKNKNEADKLVKKGWKIDNNGNPIFYVKGDNEVYRLYDKKTGRHHYTPKKNEADKLIDLGWKDEGTAWSVIAYKLGGKRVYK